MTESPALKAERLAYIEQTSYRGSREQELAREIRRCWVEREEDRQAIRGLKEALSDLVDRLDRDVPAHACPGFDCATCARPDIEPARAAIARAERP
jgi:hypothetical protein